MGEMQRRASLASVLLLCCSLFVRPSQAFFFGVRRGGGTRYIARVRGDGGVGYGEEKVPMTVVVPDYSPRPAPPAANGVAPTPTPTPVRPTGAAPTPTPTPTPTPVPGSDDDMPRLPSERRSHGAPSSGNAGAPGPAAPGAGASTTFISSNPAVPLPAGVTDSATVLPMPTPGQEQRQDVGMGTQLQARAVPLAVPLVMMLSFWTLY